MDLLNLDMLGNIDLLNLKDLLDVLVNMLLLGDLMVLK